MFARVTSAESASSFPLLGARAVPVVTGGDTGGAWEALELTLGPAAASPLHTLEADKLFYVAAGSVRVTVGSDESDVAAGGHVQVPAGTPHRYSNVSGEPARMLVVTSGASQVDFLRGMSALTAGGPPDHAELTAHTAAHGVRILPAPASTPAP